MNYELNVYICNDLSITWGIDPSKKTIMKKLLTSLVILAAFAVMPANAQIQFGVKGGLDYPNMKINYHNLINESGSGWFVGPTLKGSFPIGLFGVGADIAAFYDQRRTDTEFETTKTIKQKSILVPVNARLNFNLADAFGVYVATGPQFGFNLGDKNYKIFSDNSEVAEEAQENVRNTFQLKKSQFSWNIGLGIILLKHIELGATYNIGISETGELKGMTKQEIRETTETTKQKSWVFSAAYYF